MSANRRSFKNYFIDRRFQTKYFLLTILLLGTYTFVFTFILFLPSILTLYLDYPLDEKAEAARTFLILHGTVWPTTVAVILIFGILSIFLTHKIAGPVYRLKQALAELLGGNLDSRIHLRKWDDLQELAAQVNLFSDEMRNYITSLQKDYGQLSTFIDQLEQEIDANKLSLEVGRERIKQVQEKKKTIALTLEHFLSKSS